LVLCAGFLLSGFWAMSSPVLGQADLGLDPAPAAQADGPHGVKDLLNGLDGFADLWFLADTALVLLLALLLGASIAYHPVTRAKVATLEEFEQPKTFLMYSIVGAVCALIGKTQPAMGFVIFGIGGLMRFRTEVGQAKDTGRIILVTVAGVSCGLKLYVVAVIATAIGWLLIYFLDRQSAGRLVVKGLEREAIPKAAAAYGEVLVDAGCTIIREKKNFLKGQVAFVFQAPGDLERETLEAQFENLPEGTRGSEDWEFA
jgi:uncharacterized membrane protein YhiD involved in acid resistance